MPRQKESWIFCQPGSQFRKQLISDVYAGNADTSLFLLYRKLRIIYNKNAPLRMRTRAQGSKLLKQHALVARVRLRTLCSMGNKNQ